MLFFVGSENQHKRMTLGETKNNIRIYSTYIYSLFSDKKPLKRVLWVKGQPSLKQIMEFSMINGNNGKKFQ